MSARSIGYVAICLVMRVFIVHAHPEPKSFNGAMTRAASATDMMTAIVMWSSR